MQKITGGYLGCLAVEPMEVNDVSRCYDHGDGRGYDGDSQAIHQRLGLVLGQKPKRKKKNMGFRVQRRRKGLAATRQCSMTAGGHPRDPQVMVAMEVVQPI